MARYSENGSKKPVIPPFDRFKNKIKKNKKECWIWQAFIQPKGYGTFFDGEKMQLAHCWSYRHFKGEIPEGLQVDHLCRQRSCVNPNHLEAVTGKINCQRGLTGKHMTERSRLITHCPHGHKYTKENTIFYQGKYKRCRACVKIRSKIWYERTKEKRLPEYNRKRRMSRTQKRKISNV